MADHPTLGFLPQKPRPNEHDHSGFMVWPMDKDRVVRTCWCNECGHVWVLKFGVDWRGLPDCKGWTPVLDDKPIA